jgi:hypothetical protein
MTPEERKLVTDLFDRLAALEDAPRDPEAERLIRDGLRQAPNAVYALVQTTLVQDGALKRADAHIRELEGSAEPPRDKSFLGGARDTLLGSRGSVPSVRPPEAPSGLSPAWRTGAQPMAPAPAPETAWRTGAQPMAPSPEAAGAAAPGRGGSSFLGTAAAAAAGMIGGSLLLSGIRGMMGGGAGGAHAAFNPTGGGSGGGSPWGGGGGSIAGSDLSRQAGLDDMGRPPSGGGSGLLDATGSDAPFEEESGAGDFDEGGFDLDDMTGGGGDD